MGVEPRGGVVCGCCSPGQPEIPGRNCVGTLKSQGKPFDISKREVWEAFRQVKANQGAAGVDGQSIAGFEADLKNNLFKIWNRMSSGAYFPPAVRAVEIPKQHGGGTRMLGIPSPNGCCCCSVAVIASPPPGCVLNCRATPRPTHLRWLIDGGTVPLTLRPGKTARNCRWSRGHMT
jgi:hypothetical protein